MKKHVTVVGGGFSGMITAYFLAKKGLLVDLHEASSRLGGLLGTEKTSLGLVESAANGFLLTETLHEIFQDLDLPYLKTEKSAKKRFIYRRGITRWPLRVHESARLLLNFLPRAFLKKPLHPRSQESVWTWGHRNLSPAASHYLLAPALQGIYAGDARRMSAELILGPMFHKKRDKFRGTVAPLEGMGQFVQALEKKLTSLGVTIHKNSPYRIHNLSQPHIVCVSAAKVAGVIEPVAKELASELQRIEILPLMSVTLFFKQGCQKIEGFGCLFPDGEGFQSLGVLANSSIFKHRGPAYSETWILGGARDPQVLGLSDPDILKRIQEERKKLFHFSGEDEMLSYRIHRWSEALPHYTLMHQKILEGINLPPNLYLHGNYMGVIGLSKIAAKAKELAESLA